MENVKDQELINQISTFIDSFKPIEIPEDTNFWLVRTKGGRFYNDFCIKNFIALGWNTLHNEILIDDLDEESLKEDILLRYPGNKRPGYPINQSKTFMYEMQPDDYVIIPGIDDRPVMFGQLIEYYEDTSCTYDTEMAFLNNLPPVGESTDCPYRKRWRVKWLTSRKPESLNPYLGKLFASSHGLSKANEYSDYILSSIFDYYHWDNNYNGVFRVKQQERIRSRDLSGFLYNADFLAELLIDKETSVKSNLNSPGDIIISIGDAITNLDNASLYFWVVFFLSSDISFGPFTIQGIIPLIKNFISGHKSAAQISAEVNKTNAEVELMKAQARKENAIARSIEIQNDKENELIHAAEACHRCSRRLEIDKNKTLSDIITSSEKEDLGEQKIQ